MRGPAVYIALASLLAPSLAAQSVRGVVVDASGAPVSFAIVALADSSRAVLTDSKGLFQIADLARGRYRVRVRQIGFRPSERELEASDPLAAVRDTLTLVRLAVMLETVTVGPAAACRQTGFASAGGEGVAELFEQLALNAHRWVMIKAAGPDSVRYEKNHRYLGVDGALLGEKTDTVFLPRLRSARYQPGAMLRQESSGHLTLIIPAVEDLADARFLNTHCFRYVAQESLAGRSAHRIDFEPADNLAGVDVRGSAWLDVSRRGIAALSSGRVPRYRYGQTAARRGQLQTCREINLRDRERRRTTVGDGDVYTAVSQRDLSRKNRCAVDRAASAARQVLAMSFTENEILARRCVFAREGVGERTEVQARPCLCAGGPAWVDRGVGR